MKNIFLYAFIAGSIGTCFAQNGLEIKSVYMFQNGYNYIVSEGKVPLNNGIFTLNKSQFPSAIVGTYWFKSNAEIQSITREMDSVMHQILTPGIFTQVKHNIGKNVKITMESTNGLQTIEGNIVKVFERNVDSVNYYESNPAVFAVSTATGIIIFYRSTLNRISTLEFPINSALNVHEKISEPVLKLKFKNKPISADLGVVYMEQGSQWTPLYRLELAENGKAKFTLAAEFTAGNVAYKNVDLNLVVASPTMHSGSMVSRLINPDFNPYPTADAVEEDNYDYERSKASRAAYEPEGVVNTRNADYYIYNIKNFSLQKNGSALVSILNETVEPVHYFQCDLPFGGPAVGISSVYMDEAPFSPVFHMVRFKNPAKQPLVAGLIFIESTENNKTTVLGQPTLQSVPVGGSAKINIAQNLDIPVKQIEEEISRESGIRTVIINNTAISFDLITVKCTVHMENQGDKEVNISLKREIEGTGMKSDIEWTTKNAKPPAGSLNGRDFLAWEIVLKSKESKDFTYTYQYYSRMY